jgi:hypothetical protein
VDKEYLRKVQTDKAIEVCAYLRLATCTLKEIYTLGEGKIELENNNINSIGNGLREVKIAFDNIQVSDI